MTVLGVLRQDGVRADEPTLSSEITPIPDRVWDEMQGKSWHRGLSCPDRASLVLITVPYIGYHGKKELGQLIVAKSVGQGVKAIFDEIYANGTFRIERMELIDKYGGDDDASMAANNTSAFNCRFVGGTTTLSAHASGIAIDINPIQNPFVTRSGTFPPAGENYDSPAERSKNIIGIITAGDGVTSAFRRHGWKWGGNWSNRKDYQHFSLNGR